MPSSKMDMLRFRSGCQNVNMKVWFPEGGGRRRSIVRMQRDHAHNVGTPSERGIAQTIDLGQVCLFGFHVNMVPIGRFHIAEPQIASQAIALAVDVHDNEFARRWQDLFAFHVDDFVTHSGHAVQAVAGQAATTDQTQQRKQMHGWIWGVAFCFVGKEPT